MCKQDRVSDIIRFLLAASIGLALLACDKGSDSVTATVLYFEEQEPEIEPYRTRMMVTAKYLRMDDGSNSTSFLLFDRGKRVIYSTNAEEKNILVVPEQPAAKDASSKLTHKTVKLESSLPKVEGKDVTEYKLYTSDKECYHLFAVQGLLPDAIAALTEYRQVLAGEQTRVLEHMPIELQTPCDLANNVFVPARNLEYGFPVRQQDMTGHLRELVDYKTETVSKTLFQLPDTFQRYTTQSIQQQNASPR